MSHKFQSILLDALIIVLGIGVIAALLIPKARQEKAEFLEKETRARMKLLSEAELRYFSTGGIPPSKADTTGDTTTTEPIVHPHLYTTSFDSLKPFLPEKFQPVSPKDSTEFIIFARDSSYFVIVDPNGYGAVVNGQASWEK